MNKFLKENQTLIGLIILTTFVSFYSFQKKGNERIQLSELEKINGTLKENPYKSYDGGDMPIEYIGLKLKENNKNYFIKNCAFDVCKKKEILSLESGKKVVLFVKANDIDNEDQNVYAFSDNTTEYLNLNAFNRCYNSKWKYLIPIIIILILILLVRIVISTKTKSIPRTPKS